MLFWLLSCFSCWWYSTFGLNLMCPLYTFADVICFIKFCHVWLPISSVILSCVFNRCSSMLTLLYFIHSIDLQMNDFVRSTDPDNVLFTAGDVNNLTFPFKSIHNDLMVRRHRQFPIRKGDKTAFALVAVSQQQPNRIQYVHHNNNSFQLTSDVSQTALFSSSPTPGGVSLFDQSARDTCLSTRRAANLALQWPTNTSGFTPSKRGTLASDNSIEEPLLITLLKQKIVDTDNDVVSQFVRTVWQLPPSADNRVNVQYKQVAKEQIDFIRDNKSNWFQQDADIGALFAVLALVDAGDVTQHDTVHIHISKTPCGFCTWALRLLYRFLHVKKIHLIVTAEGDYPTRNKQIGRYQSKWDQQQQLNAGQRANVELFKVRCFCFSVV